MDDCKAVKADENALNEQKARLDWLDVLRAMAMLFVIYGHISKLGEFYLFTNPIKIPLFFAISGFLMYGREGNPKVFFSRMLKRIIIPWLILALGSVCGLSLPKDLNIM